VAAEPLQVRCVPALQDNYLWLAHDPSTGETAVVDPGAQAPVEDALAAEGWHLSHILNTHHHFDHVGANVALKARWGCTIIGPRADAARIPGLDIAVGESDIVKLGTHEAQVFDVPGHTRGHIAFWFEADALAFVGDTLFAAGCGRMFEGSPGQFWSSLSRLRALPPDTLVYCAHEYTSSNLRFALSVDPGPAVEERAAHVAAARARGEPTVPSRIADERATNPFFKADHPAMATRLGLRGASPERVFAELRSRKDSF
jgi:hydroxyacylglutathione hydrolase